MFNNIINSNCTWFYGFRSCSFNPGLLNLSSVDTWWLLTSILWCGDSPVHCSMFSRICDLYSLDISSTSIAVTPKMTPGIATCSLASRSPPVENHCSNPYSSHFPEVLIIIIIIIIIIIMPKLLQLLIGRWRTWTLIFHPLDSGLFRKLKFHENSKSRNHTGIRALCPFHSVLHQRKFQPGEKGWLILTYQSQPIKDRSLGFQSAKGDTQTLTDRPECIQPHCPEQ